MSGLKIIFARHLAKMGYVTLRFTQNIAMCHMDFLKNCVFVCVCVCERERERERKRELFDQVFAPKSCQ